MSGVLALLASADFGFINGAWSLHLEDISIAVPGVRTVSVTFATDGTTSCIGAGSAPDWYLPIVAGIGSGWSVRVAITSTMNTIASGSALETWQSLGAAKTFSFENDLTTVEGEGSATVEFSPDAGFSVAATCLVTWNAGYRA